MKWPKINVRRMDVERVLIACSAALVLLLSVQSRNVEFEPYEEPLEEIPVADVSTASLAKDMQDTVVYYEDGDGYLVPVLREVQQIPMRERAGEYLMMRLRLSSGLDPRA